MIKLKVTGQNIKVSCCDAIASDAIDVIKISFEFDNMWSGMLKAAQFTQCVDRASGETHTYSTVVTDTSDDGLTGEALLPNEIGVGQVRVSVFGVNATENTRLTTIPVVLDISQSGFVPDGETPIPPTEDLYAQLVGQVSAEAGRSEAAADRAETAVASIDDAARIAQEALDIANEALPKAKEAQSKLVDITESVKASIVEDTANAAAAAEAANAAAEAANAAAEAAGTSLEGITTRLDNLEQQDDKLFDDLYSLGERVAAYQNGETLTIGLMSDVHYHPDDVNAAEKLNTAKLMSTFGDYCHVNLVGNLGDMVRGNDPKADTRRQLMQLVSAHKRDAKAPLVFARGNHDDNGWYSSEGKGGSFLEDEMFNSEEWMQIAFGFSQDSLVIDPAHPNGGYGYYDHKDSKIRVFVLNTEDFPYILDDGVYRYNSYNKGHNISNSQLNFIANALYFADKDNPAEWSALFLSHTPIDTTNTDGYRFGIRDSLIRGYQYLLAIINAYNKGSVFSARGSTYNASLGDVQEDFSVSVSVDYSAKGIGKVVGFISGHTHADNYSNDVGEDRSLSRGYAYLGVMGSITWSNVVIDPTKNCISVVKYGQAVPDTTDGAAVTAPDIGSIESGEFSVLYNQQIPAGDNLFIGMSDNGPNYTIGMGVIDLETMELQGQVASNNQYCTKAMKVRPFTAYKIPADFNGSVCGYGISGARSGFLTIIDHDVFGKIFITGERQNYVVFSVHTPSYPDYENLVVQECYAGLVE